MTLRVQRSVEGGWVVFRLTGRIQAELIPELQQLLKSESDDYQVALDLKEVRLVDLETVRFLATSEVEGARLNNCSPFIREWISQDRNEMLDAQIGKQPP